jgi:pimeloyl-ACP methyl ester carboxylesterase
MYIPLCTSTTTDLWLRGMRYRVRTWGQAQSGAAPLILLHGWMDVGASYQFVVDALSEEFAAQRLIIAPDWRGFGRSMPTTPCAHYHFADYLGDLDALLQHYAADGQRIDLVGHSMGGNIAMVYAGARPERIRKLVNLEGFGLPATHPTEAPARITQWLNELQQLHQGKMALKAYDSVDGVAARLRKTNHRLAADHALWLAGEWAEPDAQGQWRILGDAAHKLVNPQLFRVEEMLAFYAAIRAPVLSIEASDDSLQHWCKELYQLSEYHARLQSVPDCRIARVEDAGHMLHHDQPQAVAALLEAFFAS